MASAGSRRDDDSVAHSPVGAGPSSVVTRIWSGRVERRRSAEYEDYLRAVAVPELAGRPGNRGVELLRTGHDDTTEFTLISHWDGRFGPTIRRDLAGPGAVDPQDLAGTVSFHERVDVAPGPGHPDPVDVELGPAVAAAVTPRRRVAGPRAAVVLAVLVLALIVGMVSSRRGAPTGPDDREPLVAPSSSEAAPAAPDPAVPSSTALTVAAFVPWPDPPEDHDPHVIGRPGPQVPARPSLEGWTLIYVNDQRRPTIVDLSTGDQRELVVAETRPEDVVLVEGGRIVAATDDGELDTATSRAFPVTIVREVTDAPVPIAPPAPVLCVVARPCLDRPWTSGRFGDERSSIASQGAGTDPVGVLADLLGARDRESDGRWTTFVLGGDGVASIRLPTPADDAVVWALEERG